MNLVLGIGIHYQRWDPNTGDKGSLTLDYEQYIVDAYNKFKHLVPAKIRSGRSIPVTAEVVKKLSKATPPDAASYSRERHKNYRSLLGTLSHVANFTHPELAFAISFASQFMANPSEANLTMLLGVLMYAYLAKSKNIKFERNAETNHDKNPIAIACDANLDIKRSRTGFTAYLYGMLVAWHSRLQTSVSLSTTEAEYMALAAAARFSAWYNILIGDFGIESSYGTPVHIFSDNQSALSIAKNPITHKHSRHIDRRLHWLREQTQAGNLVVAFISTPDNVSDIMTKALALSPFRKHRDHLHLGFLFKDQLAHLTNFMVHFDRDMEFLDYEVMLEEL